MKIYKYELKSAHGSSFIKEEHEVAEKPKNYFFDNGKRLPKEKIGIVDANWGSPVIYLLEDDLNTARTLLVQHLSECKENERKRHQRRVEEIESMMASLNCQPSAPCERG